MSMRILAALALAGGIVAASCVQSPDDPPPSSPGVETRPLPKEVVGEAEEPLPEDICAGILERALQICATREPGLQKACGAIAWTAYVACVLHE